MQIKPKVRTRRTKLFWGLVAYTADEFQTFLSLLSCPIPVYWDELPKSYNVPKPNFHLPDRNNSTDQ